MSFNGKVFRARNWTSLYARQLHDLIVNGDCVDVYNMGKKRNTREFLQVMSIVERPWERCIFTPGRRWNPFLALSEALWLLAGRNDVAPLALFNNQIKEFSDDENYMYGAYGYRLQANFGFNQIQNVIDCLNNDRESRQAVMSIWNPEQDKYGVVTKDRPCNDMVMFKIRNDKLYMTVLNRSNDINWGLYAVNAVQFSFLQHVVANLVGASLGDQIHVSDSLHAYLDHEMIDYILEDLEYRDKDYYPYAFDQLDYYGGDLQEIIGKADKCLTNVLKRRNEFEEIRLFAFSLRFLNSYLSWKEYRNSYSKYDFHQFYDGLSLDYPEYEDWIQIGRYFLMNLSEKTNEYPTYDMLGLG